MKKILICGNYGAKNTGDELILLGAKTTLKDFKISVLSEHTDEIYGLNHYPKFPAGIKSFFKFLFSKKENLEALKNTDYFLLGGGNLFGGPSVKANFIWALQALFAIFYKKNLIMFCQSVGDNTPRIIRYLIKFVFNKADKIYLRDEISKDILQKIGITKEIHVISDPALCIKSPENQERKNTLVALRQISSIRPNLIKEIAIFLEGKKDIKFVNFETGKENDEIFSMSVAEKLSTPSQSIDYTQTPTEILNEFSKANFALCMRLHSIICAIITDTPFIAISYAKKIDSFLSYAGLEDLIISQKELTTEKLQEKYEYLEENKTKIIEKMQKFKTMSLKKFNEIEF
ncbi:MAG: polysaccharide pyruvyl transferase family protein [Candidatus Gracilibacteria bacterium]|jgi:polysaccharide pyruvyl transferase WcaK-like protein|nr:polysaccharide pyruvyl transferase family protein [Candidatus Gracilibacteria bacterium]